MKWNQRRTRFEAVREITCRRMHSVRRPQWMRVSQAAAEFEVPMSEAEIDEAGAPLPRTAYLEPRAHHQWRNPGPTPGPDYLASVRPLPARALEILTAADEGRLLLADRLYVAREIRRAKRDVRAARDARDAQLRRVG